MSDDYVNQLTLNFLISKTQLAKLNKKIAEDTNNSLRTDKQLFREDIIDLFNKLLNNDIPSDLLHDVKDSFEHFIDKSIYYIKLHNDNEKQNTQDEIDEQEDPDDEIDELDEDPDEDYTPIDNSCEILDDGDGDGDEDDDTNEISTEIINVYKKNKKQFINTNGVEDIQKLPLDWFQNIRQNYKMTQILPRKKELVIPR